MSERRPYGKPLDLDLDTLVRPGPLGTPCRIWRWGKTALGYGVLREGRAVRYVHRIFYERVNGPTPIDTVLDHLCERPACCNPLHLEPTRAADNVRRYYSRREVEAELVRAERAHANAMQTERRHARRGGGYCRDCATPVVPGRTQCAKHLEAGMLQSRKRRARRKGEKQ